MTRVGRAIRRLAFQALFQLDAHGGDEGVLDEFALTARGTPPEVLACARRLAREAYARRHHADAEIESLAPGWPAYRQPAVDRAIFRLAHYEMTATDTPPKVVINEAVELAKEFGTEHSPAFINGVLDRVLARLRGDRPEGLGGAASAGERIAERPAEGSRPVS